MSAQLLTVRQKAHTQAIVGSRFSKSPNAYRFGHWLYHLPGSWLFGRSCGPATAVVFGFWAVGLFVAIPYATPLLLANWGLPILANATRALWHGKLSILTRPQAHQVSCVASAPHDPVETSHHGHSHGVAGHVLKWRQLLAERAEEGGRIAGSVDAWLARPSRVIKALAKVTAAADGGDRRAKVLDDFLNERSQVWSVMAEAAILGIGLGLHAPWMLVFPLEMLFHNVPDMLSAYVGARTGVRHRVFRPGMFQRRTTVEALVLKGELEVPLELRSPEPRSVEECRSPAAPSRVAPLLKPGPRSPESPRDGMG